ncbi:MAG: hypothetical protein KAR00_02565 [Candidatus Pacebacteria bacterium]|nr:hypothetical protein [Candidatus Paceibacterota bacterium]
MKKGAGIILTSCINGELYAFLRKVPIINVDAKRQAWGGSYEITAVGKMLPEDSDNFTMCALRILREETGISFFPHKPTEILRKRTRIEYCEMVIYKSHIPFQDMIVPMQKHHLTPINISEVEKTKSLWGDRANGKMSSYDMAFLPEDGIRMPKLYKEAVEKSFPSFAQV